MTLRTMMVGFSALCVFGACSVAWGMGGGGGDMGGGGGGGGMGGAPSAEIPAIDPVQRYRDGMAALDAKNYRDAQRAFRDVLTVQAKDPNANYMLGAAFIGDNKLKNARSPLERAVKVSADFALARGWLGYVYAKTGDPAKADEQKNALLALKTACAGACKDAVEIDAAIKRIEGAVADPSAFYAPAAPKLAAADGDAAYFSAASLINKGQYADALYELREAGLVFGPHPDVLTYQGFANRKLGNYQVALRYYAAALSLAPDHRGANEYLGEYYVEIGDMARARAQLAKLERICQFGCEQAYELRRWIDGRKS
jgi:tetratricopeptide (TPR) repeat protein